MDEQSRSDAWEAASGHATISGPTFGTRPRGTKFATSRSGLAALPSRPPPSPHFSGPREPGVGAPIGRISPPWYRAKWLRVTTALVVVVAIAVAAVKILGGSSGSDVNTPEAAAAPAGYRMVHTDSYEFAVPRPWNTKALDAQVMTAVVAPVNAGSGAKELTVATDPVTRDTINVVPYKTSGGSLQRRVLAEFEADFRNGVAGTQIVSLRVDPARVHGFPAGRLTASVIGNDGPAKVISTLVETTDGIFQITVTSADAERAAMLDSRVLPTFDTR